MLRSILVLALLVFTQSAEAAEKRPERPDYQVVSNVKDEDLSKRKSAFTFQVTANYTFDQNELRMSDNGEEFVVKLDEDRKFTIITKPGDHSFMFLLSSEFREIETDTISIDPSYHMTIILNFKSTEHQMLVKKPVIYLYPEVDTTVQVSIDPTGELFYTYPEYKNGWSVNASPDGDLSINDEHYNYLFWEAKQKFSATEIDLTTGSVVSNEILTEFIENKLKAYGLNSKERADFMTYWIPIMLTSGSDEYFVKFLINEEASLFGELQVQPEPNTIGRIYLLWSGADDASVIPADLAPQEIIPLDRDGFVVIEWGGAEFNLNELQSDLSILNTGN